MEMGYRDYLLQLLLAETEAELERKRAKKEVTMVNLGTLAPPIGEQLDGLSEEDAACFEEHRQAINRLAVYGLITYPEADRARRMLTKMVREALHNEGEER